MRGKRDARPRRAISTRPRRPSRRCSTSCRNIPSRRNSRPSSRAVFKAKADDAKKEAARAGDAARRAGASSLRAYSEGASQTGIAQAAYGRKQFTEAAQHFAEARRAFEVATRDAADLASKKAAAPPTTRAAEPAPTPVIVAVAPTAAPLPATPAATPVVAAPTAAPIATPPPLPRPVVDEEAAVRQVVTRLKQAIEQKDLALYKRLRPDLTAEEERRLKDAFQNVTSQQVEYAIESVSVEGGPGHAAGHAHRAAFPVRPSPRSARC